MTQPRDNRFIRCLKSYSEDYKYVFIDPMFCGIKDYSLQYLSNLTESKLKNIFNYFLESSRNELNKYQKDIQRYINIYKNELNKYYSGKDSNVYIISNSNMALIHLTDDLAICLAPYNSTSSDNGDAAQYIKEKGIIFIYCLVPGFTFNRQNWIVTDNAVLDTLSHELTHYLDYKANKEFKDIKTDTSEYYNNIREFNAYRNKLIRILERKLINKLNKKDFKYVDDIEKKEFITEFLNNLLKNCKNDIELQEFIPFIKHLDYKNLKELYEDLTRHFIAKYFESYYIIRLKPKENLLNEMREDSN